MKDGFSRGGASPAPGPAAQYTRADGPAHATPAGAGAKQVARSNANPGKIQSSSLEDSINLEVLMQLKSAFSSADKDGGGDLDMEEFVKAFTGILGPEHGGGSADALRHMFMKIDANSDGTVDWDEFSTFMLLENQATTSMKEHDRMAQFAEQDPKDEEPDESEHSDVISKILQLPSGSTYLTCSRDCTVKAWGAKDLAHQRTLHSGSAWVTDMCMLPRHNRVAVSSFSRQVTLYDPLSFDVVGGVKELDHAVMSMDCWMPEQHHTSELLAYGDVGGCLQLMAVVDNVEGSDSKPAQNNQLSLSRLWKTRSHHDWVSKVKFIPDLNSLISCSLDTTLLLTDLDHKATLRTLMGHTKGVYSFDWSETYKFIASCGMDRHVLLWNPFSARPMASLQGHNSSVMDVIINETDNQIITVGVDKHIKVWDIRNHRCMQTIVDKAHYRPEDRHTAVLYNPQRRELVTGCTRLKSWPLRARETGGKTGHAVPVVGALFNSNFMEVVSGDEVGSVCVWDLETGRMRFRFTKTHGDIKMTAMSFDKHKRRLITGGHDGSLKMWNFSNGACLKDLRARPSTGRAAPAEEEVTAIEYVHGGYHNKFIISVGWDAKVSFWEDNSNKFASRPNRQLKGHSDDILTVALYPPSLLATGCYDGLTIIWNIESGAVKCKLLPPSIEDIPADERSVEKVSFLTKRQHVLASVSADRHMRLWNVLSGHLLVDLYTGHKKGESVVALAHGVEGDADRWIVTGDSGGYVKVWDISEFCGEPVPPALAPEVCREYSAWKAHKGSVASVEMVLLGGGKRPLIVTGSADRSVALWSLEGSPVGEFGKETWVLSDPSTWRQEDPQEEPTPSQVGDGAESGSPANSSRPRSPGVMSAVSGVSELGEELEGSSVDDDGGSVGSLDGMPLPPETPEMRVHGFVSKLPPRRGGKLPNNPYNSKVYLPEDDPRDRRINHPHVNGRPPTSIAHLIHIHDLGEILPRPKTRQYLYDEDGGGGGRRGMGGMGGMGGRRPQSAAVGFRGGGGGGGGRAPRTHKERILAARQEKDAQHAMHPPRPHTSMM